LPDAAAGRRARVGIDETDVPILDELFDRSDLVGGEADEQAVAAEALVDEVVLDDLALAAEGDQEVLVAEGRNRSS
jgi:hypothetical protein